MGKGSLHLRNSCSFAFRRNRQRRLALYYGDCNVSTVLLIATAATASAAVATHSLRSEGLSEAAADGGVNLDYIDVVARPLGSPALRSPARVGRRVLLRCSIYFSSIPLSNPRETPAESCCRFPVRKTSFGGQSSLVEQLGISLTELVAHSLQQTPGTSEKCAPDTTKFLMKT